MQKFVKYHSFGNDFILLNWSELSHSLYRKLNSSKWKIDVKKWCDRHYGIGADGLLILKKSSQNLYDMQIFNSDGSSAEMCLNGIRCCAYHLFLLHPKQQLFNIRKGKYLTYNQINRTQQRLRIITHITFAQYRQKMTLYTAQGDFQGHRVDVGNPHFVIFQKQNAHWLKQYGSLIEQHCLFPNKTNVEFVWPKNSSKFKALFFERGCGMTLACSSGATAITTALHKLGMIKKEQLINLIMPGGKLQSMVSRQGNVVLIGEAHLVFSGAYQAEQSTKFTFGNDQKSNVYRLPGKAFLD